MTSRREQALDRLKFLYDQVHQTGERLEHLPERLPLPIRPESVNYGEDLARLKNEYNRLAREVQAEGLLTAADLEAAGLPTRFAPGPSG